MKPKDLTVGDRIRIIGIPETDYLHQDTMRVFKKLIARKRSVRIDRIDEYGSPWYTCRFRKKSGQWEWHTLAICDGENNWVKVRKR